MVLVGYCVVGLLFESAEEVRSGPPPVYVLEIADGPDQSSRPPEAVLEQ
jgi:hypothetical protein